MVLFVSRWFLVAIVHYVPATLFLIIVFARDYQRHGELSALVVVVGLGLTLIAAGVQQAKIGLHPIYFNHNALYHGIQALALFMLYWSARWFVML